LYNIHLTPAKLKEYYTSTEFIQILKGANSEFLQNSEVAKSMGIVIEGDMFVVVERIKVNDIVEINWNSNIFQYPIIIASGVFNQINVYNATFEKPFYIIGGHFSNGINFYDTTFLSFKIWDGTFQNDLIFNGGFLREDFQVVRGDFKKEIILENVLFEGNFHLKNSRLQTLRLLECSIGSIDIDNSALDFLYINGALVKSYSKILGGSVNIVNIIKGQFEKFEFSNCNISSFFIFGGTFNQEFNIMLCKVLQDFTVSGGTFKNLLNISGGIFKNLLIHFANDFNFIPNISIRENFQAESLIFECIESSPKNFPLTLEFNKLNISQLSRFEIKNLNINSIIFNNIRNFTNIYLSAIRFQRDLTTSGDNRHKFGIQDSDLGKITLIGCEFSGMNLDFKNSKITEMFVAGTALPENVISQNNTQKRLGYSQLKKIYENRGDSITGNQYFAKEMNVFYDELNWKNNFWEKANLWLNRFSSNHGQSWGKALGSTLIVGTILYSAYCYSLGYHLSSGAGSFKVFIHCLSHFLEFLNPLHKFDFLKGLIAISDISYLIDSLSRLVLAYFIYQFIQAFRKHGKK